MSFWTAIVVIVAIIAVAEVLKAKHRAKNGIAVDWMGEINRVLSPGGSFFFTTHGESYRDRLGPAELERFDKGESVVQFPSTEGSNLCAAYFPSSWVHARLLDGFDASKVEVRLFDNA